MKDLMVLFGVTLGKRYTKRQKSLFVEMLKKCFNKTCFVFNSSYKENVNNLIFGDLQKAKLILVCAYDTASQLLLPNTRYYPFERKRNLSNEIVNIVLELVLFLMIIIGAFWLIGLLLQQGTFGLIMSLLLGAVAFYLGYRVITGRASGFNFNHCSASVVLLVSIAQSLAKNSNVAFVFLDKAVNSYQGWKLLGETTFKESQQVIYFDGMASGEQLIYIHPDTLKVKSLVSLELVERSYSSSKEKENMFVFVDNLIYLGFGSIDSKGFYVKDVRTKKDYKIDMPKLELIKDLIIKEIGGSNE